MELIKNYVMVEWVALGEGWDGDYDEDDPEDEELLRFEVSVRGPLAVELHKLSISDTPFNPDDKEEWVAVNDASYCTRMPAETDEVTLQKGLELIMGRVYFELIGHNPIKKVCEELSWIGPDWIK